MTKQLSDLFFAHDAKRIDKWEQYLGMYQSELAPFVERNTPVRLLEIGVQNGGSLELWSKYLPSGSVVRGLDINEKVSELTFGDGDIAVFVGDATDARRVEQLFGNDRFNIIIDDGSHHSNHVIATLRLFFPLLEPGGKYIVEDLHCSYLPGYHGGFREHLSSVEWLKQFIDVLNADHIVQGDRLTVEDQQLFATFRTQLARVAFYDSVAVIDKLTAEKRRPYRRILSGEHSHVLTDEQWLSLEPIRNFEPMLSGRAAAQHLEAALIARLDAAQNRAAHLEEVTSGAARELAEARQQAREASASLMQQQVEYGRQLDAALADRDATHQTALEALEVAHQLRAALEANAAAHRDTLRTTLAAREAAYRDELGTTLSLAVKARTWLRHIAKRSGSSVSRRLHLVTLSRYRQRHREAALCRMLFDSAWYLHRYPDVAAAGIDPLEHFLDTGASELRDPNPLFDTSWYLEQDSDVAATRLNPLVHYLVFGAAEGLDPSEDFDTDWYLHQNPDVVSTGMNPLVHYLRFGRSEGRQPYGSRKRGDQDQSLSPSKSTAK